MKIIHRADIEKNLDIKVLIQAIEKGFIEFSEGKVVVPPVGHMTFSGESDLHIKYCHIPNDEYFVVKIAGFFPENVKLGKGSIQGCVMLFSQKTGELIAIFLDEGVLSHVRTAIAGALVAKYLAPQNVEGVGILGAGTQAWLQLEYLQYVTKCRSAYVWARDYEKAKSFAKRASLGAFQVIAVTTAEEICAKSNLIVTTTPSTEPLIQEMYVRPGTHITAMGSDSSGKQELEAEILRKSSLVVVDSISQCRNSGELQHMLKKDEEVPSFVQELGTIIKDISLIPKNHERITVADLTGVAVQDLVIAESVYAKMYATKNS